MVMVIVLAIVLYLYEPATGDYMINGVMMAGAYMVMRAMMVSVQ